jgi:3-oxoacyl-[acyl-carrier protein] reductase
MHNSLRGKVALVTGASRGIGRAIAEGLSRAGAAVVINYVRDADAARKFAEEIEAALGPGAGRAGGCGAGIRGDPAV